MSHCKSGSNGCQFSFRHSIELGDVLLCCVQTFLRHKHHLLLLPWDLAFAFPPSMLEGRTPRSATTIRGSVKYLDRIPPSLVVSSPDVALSILQRAVHCNVFCGDFFKVHVPCADGIPTTRTTDI